MIRRYYIEITHKESQDPFDSQSKLFSTKKLALKWLRNNFDYVSKELDTYLTTVEFDDNFDIYEVKKSEKVD